MAERLTRRDLHVIVEALAFRLADDIEEDGAGSPGEYQAAFDKIQRRLDRQNTPTGGSQ